MSTTNLFVELVVIGIFATAWVVMALIACLGIPDIAWNQIPVVVAAAPILAVIYVLGIITDRIADSLFEGLFLDRLRVDKIDESDGKSVNTPEDKTQLSRLADKKYRELKLQILCGPDRIAELGEYARSRARICRGVAFNGTIALFVMNVWMSTLGAPAIGWPDRLSASLAVWLVVIGAWYSWRSITLAGIDRMALQAKFAVEGARWGD